MERKPPSKLSQFKVEYINNLPPKAGFSRSGTKIFRPTKSPKWLKSFINWYNNPSYNWMARKWGWSLRKTLHKLWSTRQRSGVFSFRRKLDQPITVKDLLILILLALLIWAFFFRHAPVRAEPSQTAIQGVGAVQNLKPVQPTKVVEITPVEPYVIPVPRPLGDFVPGNGYDSGNCTWYAKSRRPDLPSGPLGNADTWAVRAAAYGFKVSDEPIAGAIGQVRNSMHVVYIEGVNDDGTVNVSAMNENGLGSMSYYTAPASRFIYIW